MIVKKIEDTFDTEREVYAKNGNWVSRRLLLHNDGMGFSFHETVIFAGTETHIWYKNHLESVYCIEGKGELVDRETDTSYEIVPGVLYALDRHDRHILRAFEDLRLLCVFNPPLTGLEDHDADGTYPLLAESGRE